MYDSFPFGRGRPLFEEENIYCRLFLQARQATAEHNIYERTVRSVLPRNENSRKSTENEENGR